MSKDNKKKVSQSKVEETSIQEQHVVKDNVLDAYPVGTTVYLPYISVIDNVYEVRECVIESIEDIVDNGVITIFYKAKVLNTKDDNDIMTLNILTNISTSYEDAEKELNNFLSQQVKALEEHTESITVQLKKNQEHIKMFEGKLK